MKTSISPKRMIIFVVSIAVLFIGSSLAFTTASDFIFGNLHASLDIFSSSPAATDASLLDEAVIGTDRYDYSPGEIVEISGDGFLPNETVRLQVNYSPLPMVRNGASEVASGHLPWDVTADFAGRVSSQWLVEQDSLNQRLQLTADGLQSGSHAEAIFTDAAGGTMGAAKAMYRLATNVWTTGNAGSTVEGKWISYMYVLENIDPNEPLPSFSITYPIFIAANDAIYFDGASNFRYCIDTPANDCESQGGSTPGSLPDGTPRPISNDTNGWNDFVPTIVNAPFGSCIDPANPIATGTPGVNSPCELRYFRVTPGSGSVPTAIGSASRITFFFELHFAQTPLWANALERHFEPGEANAVLTDPAAFPLNLTHGYDLYEFWTNPFLGSGPASVGSSQHVNITDFVQGAGGTQNTPSGQLTLPIPTVVPALAHVVSGQKFEDANGDGVEDPGEPGLAGWTITLTGTLEDGVTNISFPTVTDSNGNYSYSQIFPGTYTLNETAQAGYVQTAPNNTGTTVLPNGSPNPIGLTHSGGSGTYNLCIESDPASAVCPSNTASPSTVANIDFGNQQPFGHIIVDKITDPANDPQSFEFNASGGSYVDFSLTHADAPNDQTLVAGNYSVLETVPDGWDLTSSPCNSSIGDTETIGALELDPGETITCTFTNTKRATVIVKKVMVGGTDTFSFTGTPNGSIAANNGTIQATVVPGMYQSVEGSLAGWDLNSISCDDANSTGSVGTATATFNAEAGETVTCTFTNTKRATVIVKKVMVGGTATFGFTGTPNGSIAANNGTIQATVVPGMYQSVEGSLAGWDLNSISCDDANSTGSVGTATATFNAEAGETVTCTFTNTKRATVIVKKVMVGGTATFGFTGTPNGSIAANNGTIQATVVPGMYQSVEGSLAGWDLNSISCDDANSTGSVGTATATFNAEAGETVTCTFTNTKRATVIVKKVMVGGTATFEFTGTPNGSIAANNGTIQATVVPGMYQSVEGSLAGWDLNSISCDDANSTGSVGTATATFNAEAGETVTCTFTNTKRATVIVKKVMVGGTATFGFTGTPNGSIAANNGTIQATVVPGMYQSVEGSLAGWDLNSISCDDANSTGSVGTATATFNAEAGETVTCTFTNTKRATVIVKKVMVGGTATFGFTGTPNGSIAANNGTIQATVVPGMYQSVEGSLAGWDLNSISCDDANSTGSVGTATATFNAEAGETVTCTFTNTKRATVIVKKVMVGGTATFGFTGTPNGSIAANNGTIQATVVPGMYQSVEGSLAGWDLNSISCDDANSTGSVGTATATFNAEAGETVTCTFTNTKRATVIVKKVMVGGTATFEFTGTPNGSIAANNGTIQATVVPGMYQSVEGSLAGWDLNSISCDDANSTGSVGTATATFNAEAGETVTCTFTNTKRATVIVKKVMVGGTATFGFTGTPNGSIAANNGTIQATVVPGMYQSVEGSLAGWDLNSISCDDANSTGDVGTATATFNAEAGETVICTFTNTKRGRIIVDKVTNPTGSSQSFGFTTMGTGYIGFSLMDADAPNDQSLAPGPYSVTETGLPDWDLTTLACVGTGFTLHPVTRTVSINLAAGETVTCTFTNTQRGAIKIVKNTVGGDGTFQFNPTGFNANASFDLVTSGGMQMQTFSNIRAGGTYSITETSQTGWDPISFTCDHASSPASITVAVGETTTCTATNRKRGSIKIIKDALPDAAQDFVFDASGLNGDLDFTLDDDNEGTNSNMITFNNVVPGGSYSVVENVTPLWQLAGITCQSTGGMDNNTTSIPNRSVVFNLEAGEAITCTFRNINVVGFVTSSSLCTFDVDPVKTGSQFRLLFTPDNSVSVYKMNASNPGQYYYNVLHYSDPTNPNDNVVTMNIPFPFVTHGATPIHVYSNVITTQVDGQTCLEPSGEISNQQDQITFASYTNPVLGVTTTSVDVDVPDGFSYVNIHLDFGLKHTTGYEKSVMGDMNNAIQTIDPGPFRPDIPDCRSYTFSNGGVHVVQSINSFKKNPGVGGSNRTLFEEPIPGQTLILKTASGVIVGRPGETDEDGWYFISYKHTGKPALYTVTWLETGQTRTVQLKANGMAEADFTNSP